MYTELVGVLGAKSKSVEETEKVIKEAAEQHGVSFSAGLMDNLVRMHARNRDWQKALVTIDTMLSHGEFLIPSFVQDTYVWRQARYHLRLQ